MYLFYSSSRSELIILDFIKTKKMIKLEKLLIPFLCFIILTSDGGFADSDIFAPKGSLVEFPVEETLQIRVRQGETCNRFTWQVKLLHTHDRQTIIEVDTLCHPFTTNENYQNRTSVSRNGSLLLYNVETEDSGKYVMMLDNLKGRIEKIFMLHVAPDISATVGSLVVFPMKVKIQFSQAQEEICNRFTWEVKRIHSKYRKTIAIADALCNPVTIYGNYENRAQVSENGSLLLHRVKTKDSGEYFITVDDLERRKWFEHKITLQVKGPSNNQNSKKGGNSVN